MSQITARQQCPPCTQVAARQARWEVAATLAGASASRNPHVGQGEIHRLIHVTGLTPRQTAHGVLVGMGDGSWSLPDDALTRRQARDRDAAAAVWLLRWASIPAQRWDEQLVLSLPLWEWVAAEEEAHRRAGRAFSRPECRHLVLQRFGWKGDTERRRMARWLENKSPLLPLAIIEDAFAHAELQLWDVYDGTPGRPAVPHRPLAEQADDRRDETHRRRWCPSCHAHANVAGRATLCPWCGTNTLPAIGRDAAPTLDLAQAA